VSIQEGEAFTIALPSGKVLVRLKRYLSSGEALIEYLDGPKKGGTDIIVRMPKPQGGLS
jgi:hypothetical protein